MDVKASNTLPDSQKNQYMLHFQIPFSFSHLANCFQKPPTVVICPSPTIPSLPQALLQHLYQCSIPKSSPSSSSAVPGNQRESGRRFFTKALMAGSDNLILKCHTYSTSFLSHSMSSISLSFSLCLSGVSECLPVSFKAHISIS